MIFGDFNAINISTLAESYSAEVVFKAARFSLFSQSWHYLLFALVIVLLIGFSWWMYRRDSVELKSGCSWFLLSARITALLAVVLFFIQHEKRVDQLEIHPSRVLMLVDTSISMAKIDPDANLSGPPQSRIDKVTSLINESELISQLRKTHFVDLYSFDQDAKPQHIITLAKKDSATSLLDNHNTSDEELTSEIVLETIPTHLWQLLIAVSCCSVLLCIVWIVRTRGKHSFSIGQFMWAVAGVLLPAVPVVVLILLILDQRNVVDQTTNTTSAAAEDDSEDSPDNAKSTKKDTDWKAIVKEKLVAKGVETRLGQAVAYLLNAHQADPISGMILFSDGGQNEGIAASVASKLAKELKISIYPVGLGSLEQAANIRIIDFATPSRVYPNDEFSVSGTITANGLSGRDVTVELFSVAGTLKDKKMPKLVGTKKIEVPQDGKLATVKFTVTPEKVGRYTYIMKLDTPPEDSTAEDNEAPSTVEVVDRKLRVLLFAGGPTREYRYLRNQLHRDKDVIVDVLLQTIKSATAISQDANKLLLEFPKTKQELATYDCIVAFDPDWRVLNAEQVDMLEDWVGSQSGGLIGIAGPVYTSLWASNPQAPREMAKIRALYPVVFPRTVGRFDHQKFRSESSWPISMTRAGSEASFLRLEDDVALNQEAWDTFEGVYGYYPVKGAKPGALIYGRYDDPRSVNDSSSLNRRSENTAPVYFAGHFYGSGRVFYMGSGEMWRIRALSEGYFEQYYIKLLRYVSEGKLNQGSTRGALFVDQKYIVGDTISIRAKLNTPQLEPLTQKQVTMKIIEPSQKINEVILTADKQRAGFYQGLFLANSEGSYQLELGIPKSEEVLSKTIRCAVPNKENEYAIRNDALLNSIAKTTGGKYLKEVEFGNSTEPLLQLNTNLKDVFRATRIKGNPSYQWDRRWAICLLVIITSMLFLQWTTRRILKLA